MALARNCSGAKPPMPETSTKDTLDEISVKSVLDFRSAGSGVLAAETVATAAVSTPQSISRPPLRTLFEPALLHALCCMLYVTRSLTCTPHSHLTTTRQFCLDDNETCCSG